MSERVEIIAYRSRLTALRHPTTPEDACACNLIRLGYLPERTVGDVTHGCLVCVRGLK